MSEFVQKPLEQSHVSVFFSCHLCGFQWMNSFLIFASVQFSCAALIRHNKSGIAAFRLANGYAALRDALGSESVRFQR